MTGGLRLKEPEQGAPPRCRPADAGPHGSHFHGSHLISGPDDRRSSSQQAVLDRGFWWQGDPRGFGRIRVSETSGGVGALAQGSTRLSRSAQQVRQGRPRGPAGENPA
jgi:hypothetical protein